MNIEKLYNELQEAFSDANLNRITAKLILLYKSKSYSKIREIANKISKYYPIEEVNDSKCFSKLIMLYHPDKGEALRNEISVLFNRNDYEKLNKYSHVFLLDDMDFEVVEELSNDIDYAPEYYGDVDYNDGYTTDDLENEPEFVDYEKTFYNIIKIKEYGRVDIEFPPYYLEDFEEYEMSCCGMESLDGVEYCKHLKILDVSNNLLSDISELWNLQNLQELYLSNNQIGYIDALGNLSNLKIIDLTANQVDDISPLLELDNLEFVNLIGTSVHKSQIEMLRERGVVVMI